MQTEIGILGAGYRPEEGKDFVKAYDFNKAQHFMQNDSKAKITPDGLADEYTDLDEMNHQEWFIKLYPLLPDTVDKLEGLQNNYTKCHWQFAFEDGTAWQTKTPIIPLVQRGYKSAALIMRMSYGNLEEIQKS